MKVYAQDTTNKLKQIDSLVFAINHSELFSIKHDSIIQDMPALKLSMKTYVTTVVDGRELKKYANNVRTKTEENGIKKDLITSNAFYYESGQLIKVEEYMADSSHEQRFAWYYADDKLLYHIFTPDVKDKSEKLLARAGFLLTTSKVLAQKVEMMTPKM